MAWDRIWLVAWMNSCALALLAMFASSILKSRAVSARTPPVVQSTPVCRLQGRAGAAGGGGGGGGGLLADDDDTEEDEGSDDDKGNEEEEQGGEARGLGASSGGGGFPVGVAAWGMLGGLDGGGVGLV